MCSCTRVLPVSGPAPSISLPAVAAKCRVHGPRTPGIDFPPFRFSVRAELCPGRYAETRLARVGRVAQTQNRPTTLGDLPSKPAILRRCREVDRGLTSPRPVHSWCGTRAPPGIARGSTSRFCRPGLDPHAQLFAQAFHSSAAKDRLRRLWFKPPTGTKPLIQVIVIAPVHSRRKYWASAVTLFGLSCQMFKHVSCKPDPMSGLGESELIVQDFLGICYEEHSFPRSARCRNMLRSAKCIYRSN